MTQNKSNFIDLILIYQNQPYLIYPYPVRAVSTKQGKNSFYYKLNNTTLAYLKKISFKKILITYPDVKTFLPRLPALHKKEYNNLWQAILPPEMLQKGQIYIQAFFVTSTQIRFAYYRYNKKKFSIKNIPFIHNFESVASYFFNKSLIHPQNKNVAFCTDNEIIIVQKYFSDIQYFPNLHKLPNVEFLKAVQSITNIEIDDTHFFLVEQKEKNNSSSIAENKFFFFPVYQDFFNSKKLITWKTKRKKRNKSAFVYAACIIILCFSFLSIVNNFYSMQKLQTDLFKIRQLQKQLTQNNKTQELFTRGIKAFHQQIIQELIQSSFLFPYKTLKEIEQLSLTDAWLVFFSEDDTRIILKVASLKTDFWEQNKTIWQEIFKKDILLSGVDEGKITYFSLEIKK